MATVTGVIGQDNVELDNAASEDTLRKLLAATNALNQSIIRVGARSANGAGGGNPGNAQTIQQTAALNQGLNQLSSGGVSVASTALRGLASSVGTLSKGIGMMGGVIAGLGQQVSGIAGQMLDGKGKVSDFYNSLSGIPIVGFFAGIFGKIAAMQEAELDTYRKLTTAGINFGGALTTIRQNALNLGMDLDGFGQLMTKNSKTFASMGGSANDGAEAFVLLAKKMRDDNVGRELRSLGFTSEQATQGLASYIEMSGGRNASEMRDTKALSNAAGSYLKQLDLLSQITGESREELEKQVQEQAKNAAWQNYLSTLDEEGRKRATEGLAVALAKGGKGAADALQAKLLGIPPLTEAGQLFLATAGSANKAVDGIADGVNDRVNGDKKIAAAAGQLVAGLSNESKKYSKETLAALTMQGGGMAAVATGMLNAQREMRQKGFTTEQEYSDWMAGQKQKQEDLSRSAAAQAAESEKAFKDMGAAIYGALSPALKILTPIVNDLATQFMGFIKNNMPAIKEALTSMVVIITDFGKNLMSQEGRDKIINDISYYFKLMLIDLKLAAIPWYSESNAKADRAKLDANKETMDRAADAKRTEMANTNELAALTLSKNKNEKAKVEAQIVEDNARIEALNKLKEKNKTLNAEQETEYNAKLASIEKNKKLIAMSDDKTAMAKAEETTKKIAVTRGPAEKEFYNKMYETLLGEAKKAGVKNPEAIARLGAAQSTLETGHGKHTAGGNNYFGIKSKPGDPNSSGVSTQEYENGKMVTKKQGFRKYDSMEDSAADYIKFLQENKRYKGVLGATSAEDAINAQGATGYATDPAYRSKLMSMHNTNKGQAATGGFFAGPRSGYNVQLHGKELVVPMNNDEQVSKSAIAPGGMSQESQQQAMNDMSPASAGTELLLSELQTLNKNTEELLRWTKESADHARQNVDATKSLTGNLFA